MKLKNRKRFFIHTPAFYGKKDAATGKFISKRLGTIQNPFHPDETKPWRRNIYYFWWEFLRRHEGYKSCCERGGEGRYKALYSDWGNIHAYKDFWKWWSEEVETSETRGEYLFAEPYDFRQIEEVRSLNDQTSDDLVVRIPLEVRTAELTRSLRRLLQQHTERSKAARKKSRARYPVQSAVPLTTLLKTLEVHDLFEQHKGAIARGKLKQYELCDMAQLHYDNKVEGMTLRAYEREFGLDSPEYKKARNVITTRMNQAIGRYRDAANDYIENAGRGVFPLRSKAKGKSKTAN